MDSLYEPLTKLREALEDRCPECEGTGTMMYGTPIPVRGGFKVGGACSSCHSTGKYVRPEYLPLWNVAVERCLDHCARTGAWSERCEEGARPNPGCFYCRGTGYVVRTCWDEVPDGALEGALVKALITMGYDANDFLIDTLCDLLAFQGDTRIAALEAVTRAVKAAFIAASTAYGAATRGRTIKQTADDA